MSHLNALSVDSDVQSVRVLNLNLHPLRSTWLSSTVLTERDVGSVAIQSMDVQVFRFLSSSNS